MKQLQIRVSGRVQMVGYRWFTLSEAQKSNIKGSVKNSYNGEVEIIAQGDEKQLTVFIDMLKIGPSRAIVEKVDFLEMPVDETLNTFRIKG